MFFPTVQLGLNKDDITLEKMKQAGLVILAAPQELFSKSEMDALKHYVETGGKVLILLSEGGENKYTDLINIYLKAWN